jgi:group II intron reverse transcriptase/maturase
MDRLIQQALLQVLTPIFDPQFSEASYGFRPGRKAHDAVRKVRQYVEEGYEWAVDLDIEKFFAGVMINGVVIETAEGTPQGGPLSPLLANILLDDLDKELEKRGHRFVRYADDCNIYVKSKRAGERVMASIRKFLQERLKLKVNEQKSAVDRPWKLKFLGFSMHKAKGGKILIRLAPQTIERVKEKIRGITDRNKPISMAERIERLNSYLGGWMGYFTLAETLSVFKELEGWMRRRLRMCLWKQ